MVSDMWNLLKESKSEIYTVFEGNVASKKLSLKKGDGDKYLKHFLDP